MLDVKPFHPGGDVEEWLARFSKVLLDDPHFSGLLGGKYEQINQANRPLKIPSSVSASAGTPTGTVANVQVLNDGSDYQLAEVTSTPGLRVVFSIPEVQFFRKLIVKGRYSGTGTHYVSVGFVSPSSGSDVFLAKMEHNSNDTDLWYELTIPDSSSYISDGVVSVVFSHTMAGTSTSHHLHIDYLALD